LKAFQISLAAARVNAGMTQKQIAEKMHVTERSIINWEKGNIVPNTATLNMLSNIYGIPVDGFLLPTKST
jgi:transcriptional regulator with XRE-family HTH domain